MNEQMSQVKILLLEDDDGDAKAISRAFKKAKIANPIIRAVDGIDGLEFLKGENGKEKLEPPYVLLVDINMPRMDGLEFIEHLRQDEQLKQSVVFILSTSKNEEDKHKAYELNVAGYIYKETAGSDFLNLVDLMKMYWRIVELPKIRQ